MSKIDRRFPVIDIGRCSRCQGCISVVPEVFFFNENTGNMDVFHFESYPVELVEEAMKNCPKDCISWSSPESTADSFDDFSEDEILGIG